MDWLKEVKETLKNVKQQENPGVTKGRIKSQIKKKFTNWKACGSDGVHG